MEGRGWNGRQVGTGSPVWWRGGEWVGGLSRSWGCPIRMQPFPWFGRWAGTGNGRTNVLSAEVGAMGESLVVGQGIERKPFFDCQRVSILWNPCVAEALTSPPGGLNRMPREEGTKPAGSPKTTRHHMTWVGGYTQRGELVNDFLLTLDGKLWRVRWASLD